MTEGRRLPRNLTYYPPLSPRQSSPGTTPYAYRKSRPTDGELKNSLRFCEALALVLCNQTRTCATSLSHVSPSATFTTLAFRTPNAPTGHSASHSLQAGDRSHSTLLTSASRPITSAGDGTRRLRPHPPNELTRSLKRSIRHQMIKSCVSLATSAATSLMLYSPRPRPRRGPNGPCTRARSTCTPIHSPYNP